MDINFNKPKKFTLKRTVVIDNFGINESSESSDNVDRLVNGGLRPYVEESRAPSPMLLTSVTPFMQDEGKNRRVVSKEDLRDGMLKGKDVPTTGVITGPRANAKVAEKSDLRERLAKMRSGSLDEKQEEGSVEGGEMKAKGRKLGAAHKGGSDISRLGRLGLPLKRQTKKLQDRAAV